MNTNDVKILKEKIVKDELKTVTMQLRQSLLERLDEAAAKVELSRQKLIGSILETALDDKTFVVKVKE